ncbi:Zinc-type alcohol dehydrogenase-like protein C16A3.02c like [Verticillium longisporum]|nr:Zinc-type alcohol dehydrogenase-like protein C16A3.02c like [Verticillium longisporum]
MPPSQQMKAWQLSSPGHFEKNLKLHDDLPRLPIGLETDQLFIQVLSAGINPADYKVPELGVFAHAMVEFPKTAGMDFCGRVVAVGKTIGDIRPSDLVLGRLEPSGSEGSLAEFIVASYEDVAKVPTSVDIDVAAGAPTAALTAYQTICPHVKKGDKIFINGGSGGTGTFGIQIAKALGCFVTVSCSADKAALCKELGADETIDYTSCDVTQILKERGQVYKLCVDNVGNSPADLYTESDTFLVSKGQYVHVGGAMTLDGARRLSQSLLLPKFLGGGKRKFQTFLVKNDHDDLQQISDWIAQGKLKTIIDSTFEFDEVPKAYLKLKGERGQTPFGKIVVHVVPKP